MKIEKIFESEETTIWLKKRPEGYLDLIIKVGDKPFLQILIEKETIEKALDKLK